MPTYASNILFDTAGRNIGDNDGRPNAELQNVDVGTQLTLGNGSLQIMWGQGDPAVNATPAAQGSLYLRQDGGPSSSLYIKTGPLDGDWTTFSLLSGGTLTADLVGNVTGNVTGNLTGDVTGNLTGNVTGTLNGATNLFSPLPTSQGGTGQVSTAIFPTSGTVATDVSTQNLSNKTLVFPSEGNTVTKLNMQQAVAAITGDVTDHTLYTCIIPANVIQAGKGIRVTVGWNHSTGSASCSYKLWFGVNVIGSWTNSTTGANCGQVVLFNNDGFTNAQTALTLAPVPGTAAGTTDTTSAQTLRFSFNVASTDQIAGLFWLVEAIQ